MEKILDYYSALQLPRDLPHTELMRQLKKVNNTWAGRNTTGGDAKVRAEAEERVRQCKEALREFDTPESTAKYNAKLEQWNASAAARAESEQSGARASEAAETEDLPALMAKGWDLLYAGNVPDALVIASGAKQRFPNNFEVLGMLGECYLHWDEPDEALATFRQAAKLQPNHGGVYASMGQAYERKEAWKEAYAHYRKASVIEPSNVSHRAAMGLVCVKAEEPDEGIALLRKCMVEEPSRKDVSWALAVALLDSARMGWTYVPPGHPTVQEGYYAMNRSQALQAIEKVREAASLDHGDLDLVKQIEGIKSDVQRSVGREFTGTWGTMFVGLVLWIFANGVGIAFAIAYYFASLTPRYTINKQALLGISGSATRERLAQMMQENRNGGVALFVMAMWGIAFPIIVVVNAIKNYTGENAYISVGGGSAQTTIAGVLEKATDRVAQVARAQPKHELDPCVSDVVVPALSVVSPDDSKPPPKAAATPVLFCTECGIRCDGTGRFCTECGMAIEA